MFSHDPGTLLITGLVLVAIGLFMHFLRRR